MCTLYETKMDEIYLAHIPDCAVFAEDVVHFLASDFVGQVAHVEHAVDLGRQPHVLSVPVHRHRDFVNEASTDSPKYFTLDSLNSKRSFSLH